MTFREDLNNVKDLLLKFVDNKEEYYNLDLYYGDDQIAKDVIKNKYFAPWETCPMDMWLRSAYGAAQAENTEDTICQAQLFLSILTDWKFVPGGRINYGLGRDDIKVSYSNCYVNPIKEDSLSGIYDCLKQDALTYKTGGGCGNDLSCLRPSDAEIKGTGGFSCGPTGFMELFSTSTNTVSQKARRGALMLSLLCSHPDIEQFITIKNDTETILEKLKNLMALYPKNSTEFKELESFVNSKRAVQHANISVKLTDEFLTAVENDSTYDLVWNNKVSKTIQARDLWKKIIHNAWSSAEPGLIFWDRMRETNNLEYVNPILSTNPCIVGDTFIAVADGRNAVSIKQLMEDGKDVPVYSTNLQTGQVEIKIARNARITGYNKEVLKLTLDDHSTLIATPNHKVLLKSLEYKELKDLQPGDSIFSFSRNIHCVEEDNAVIKVVESIVDFGTADVYNISVDDNHNYHIVNNTIHAKTGDVFVAGICIKNCSEIPLGAYGNCLLGHINLTKHVTKTEDGKFEFNTKDFERTIQIAMRFLDNIITLNDGRHALPEQNDIALKERRTGLGITGLGDTLIMLGMRYGSKESLEFIDSIMQKFRDTAYIASANLAIERGSFPWFDKEKFMQSKFVQNLPAEIQSCIAQHGIRNGMLLTCAPVGTGSIISQVSSGIEPLFRIAFNRMVKNPDNVTFSKYTVYNPIVKKLFGDIRQGLLPSYVVDSSQISPEERVDVQAVIQKYIDNSISSTVNLPKTATEDDVERVYIRAWKTGCKGITVYREGSREGILVSIDDKKQMENKDETINELRSYKRPTKLCGETYKLKVDLTGKEPYNCYLTVNFKEDTKKPFEILVTESNSFKDMKDIMAFETTTRLVSLALRHNIPIEFIIDQLEKIQGQYIYSLPVSIAKVLSNYMDNEDLDVNKNEEFDDEDDDIDKNNGLGICPACGKRGLKRENGCMSCILCTGYYKCS